MRVICEKMDHIIGDMHRTMIHQSDCFLCGKCAQTPNANEIRKEHGSNILEKDLGVDVRPVIRFQYEISSVANTLLSELLLNCQRVM
jgi:hypothetical protein